MDWFITLLIFTIAIELGLIYVRMGSLENNDAK
jgi:hypothetical protein